MTNFEIHVQSRTYLFYGVSTITFEWREEQSVRGRQKVCEQKKWDPHYSALSKIIQELHTITV